VRPSPVQTVRAPPSRTTHHSMHAPLFAAKFLSVLRSGHRPDCGCRNENSNSVPIGNSVKNSTPETLRRLTEREIQWRWN